MAVLGKGGSEGTKWPSWRVVGAALIMVAIFAVDTLTSLKGAVATLYLLVLIFRAGEARTVDIRPWAVISVALAAASHLIVHGANPDADAVMRLAVSTAAILSAAVLIGRAQKAFRAVADSEARYRTTFDAIAIPVCEYDLTPLIADPPRLPRLLAANQAARRRFGLAEGELDRLALCPDGVLYQCREVVRAGRGHVEHESIVTDAASVPREVLVVFSLDDGVPLTRVPVSIKDISEERRLDRAVADARLQMERAHRATMLGQASAAVSHEINQPLAAIRSFASAAQRWMARDPVNLDEVRTAVAGLVMAVDRASDLVARVRSVTGGSKFERVPLRVADLVDDTVSLLKPELARQGFDFLFIQHACATTVQGDAVLLRQVLVNLVFNAAQAMSEARQGRQVSMRLSNGDDGLSIEVEDEGPGFPAGFAELATEPFWTTKRDGMGIGLSISRMIVEALDGSITLSNRPEGGARVEIKLPV